MCININNILIIPIMGSIISTLTYSLVGGVSYVCYKMTDKVFALIKNSLRNYICSNIQISNGNNSKILYALQQEVEQNVKKTALTNVRDNGVKPVFTLPYGIHKITTKQFGVIYVDYDDKGMKLYNLSKLSVCPPRLRKRTIELQNYIQDVYDKHCIRSQIIVSYTAENDKWSFPIMRRPTQFLKKIIQWKCNKYYQMCINLKQVRIFTRNMVLIIVEDICYMVRVVLEKLLL
ncbi:chaperone [Megavirus lba]|uniref:Chaperone n=1 Tax=Megavirus lba TaxID=1235314 RepID=L7Y1V9_9VIRU|nr:chaperone [Megavirus lba]